MPLDLSNGCASAGLKLPYDDELTVIFFARGYFTTLLYLPATNDSTHAG